MQALLLRQSVQEFHKHLSHEREVGNLTITELDEKEIELAKLRSRLSKIRVRGSFKPQVVTRIFRHLAGRCMKPRSLRQTILIN